MERLVNYKEWCEKCKYRNVEEDEDGIMPDPCNECLTIPVNEDSRKPIHYTEDK